MFPFRIPTVSALAAALVAAASVATVPPSTAGATTLESGWMQTASLHASSSGVNAELGEPTPGEPHIDFTDDANPIGVQIVTDRVDAMDANARELAAEQRRNAPNDGIDFLSAAGDYSIDYVSTPPAGHAAVFEAVMETWADEIDFNSGGIQVEVYYQSLGGSALAGAVGFTTLEGPPGARYSVPTALRNAQSGGDQFPSQPDIRVYVNTDQNWNTAQSGSISNGQYSLFATLLHEVGHGLGFSSSFRPTSTAGETFSSFDQRLYHDSASGSPSGPTAPTQSITSPVVRTGAHWFLNLDGTWERIYDPTANFQSGSSMSHYDESTYGPFGNPAPGSLMTPTLYDAEVVYGVDAVVLGAMEAIGWTVEDAPAAPAIVSASVDGALVNVSVSPSTATSAPPATGWRATITDSSGVLIASFNYDATDRTLVLPIELGEGNYTVSVSGYGSGGTSVTASQQSITSTNVGVVTQTFSNCRQAPVNPAFGTTDDTNASVYRLYCAYFLRYPDQGGFSFWLDEFASGSRDLNEISEFFAVSPEFKLTYGSLSNRDFVQLIYTNILEREPDTTGFDFWLGELDTGSRTRGWLMLFFSQSDEFRIKTGT